ncbi:MAG: transposase [Armatimonas sp.]
MHVDVVKVFRGILFVLKTGARWEDVDKKINASRQTYQRYFAERVESGVFQKTLVRNRL